MLRKIFLAAALVAAPATADTPEWQYVGRNTSGSSYYIRTVDWLLGNSSARNGRAWVMTDDRKNASVSWSASKTLFAIDCVAQTYATLQSTFYYRNGSSSTDGAGPVRYTVPGSIVAEVVSDYCADPR